MVAITRPAVEIRQGELTLYLTYVTPNELAAPNFYTVDVLEPQGQGFQRILNQTRANRLSRHLTEGFDSGYANLPTTIFLATDKIVGFDSGRNEISFETDKVCPFSVVDGQHRIEGVIRSLKNKPQMGDFKLPATIAVSLDDTHQMYHFYIVNTTQEPVEQALRQQIITRFSDMKGIYNLPYLPHWFDKPAVSGSIQQSLRLAEFLNEDPESPLRERIQMANDGSPVGNRVKQAGLVSIFKDNIFTGTNPIFLKEPDADKRNQIMLNYFRAVDSLFVSPESRTSTQVYKNNGLYFFALVSKWVFTSLYASGLNFTAEAIAKTIQDAVDEMDHPYHYILDPEWWIPGRGASSLNRANAREYANEFLRALGRSEQKYESS